MALHSSIIQADREEDRTKDRQGTSERNRQAANHIKFLKDWLWRFWGGGGLQLERGEK